MIRYMQRFERGNMLYMAWENGKNIFNIYENKTFIGGWDVVNCNSNSSSHFESLEAAKNFCETSIIIRNSK